MMTNEEKYEYWLDIAQYDLVSADYNFKSGRWVFVAFLCQQAIEKLVKGLYILYNEDDNVPKIHNSGTLMKTFENKLNEPIAEDTYAFFDKLSGCYIVTRYPDYKKKLASL